MSEPQPISRIIEAIAEERGCQQDSCQTTSKEDILRGLVNTYGQRRLGNENGFVIKFSSWNILQLTTIRRLWPDVPVLIVLRDPTEVAVSCVTSPPGWMSWKDDSALCSRLFGWTDGESTGLSPEAFCARVIGEFCRNAIMAEGPMCRIIDYNDITLDGVLDVADLFKLEVPVSAIDLIKDSLVMYSKSSKRTTPFKSDREAKQKEAPSSLRVEISKWAQPAYDEAISGAAGLPDVLYQ